MLEVETQVPKWKEAMDSEVEASVSLKTWTLAPRPADDNIVIYKWVFTFKCHHDDTIAHYKAHLVTRGFTHAYGIDYIETFSLVVHLQSIRVLLSLGVNQA